MVQKVKNDQKLKSRGSCLNRPERELVYRLNSEKARFTNLASAWKSLAKGTYHSAKLLDYGTYARKLK